MRPFAFGRCPALSRGPLLFTAAFLVCLGCPYSSFGLPSAGISKW
ncbi:hypothetical protein AWU68_1886 [Corynebacterium simulans]|nr:hypothetical protein AWU68_1886 [Corynebacterium simulans]